MSWTWPWEQRSISIICKNSSAINSWLNTLEPKTKSNIEKEIKVFDSNKDSYINTQELEDFVSHSQIFFSDRNLELKNKILDALGSNLSEISIPVYDVVVREDSIAGIFAVLGAARAAKEGERVKRVLLVRSSGGRLGDVLTRGNLAYLDRNQPTLSSNGIWKEFLQRAGVNDKQIALDPNRADEVLRQMLEEARVTVISNTQVTGFKKENNQIHSLTLTQGEHFLEVTTSYVIEAGSDLKLAKQIGLKTVKGVPEIGVKNKTLSVSPVFSINPVGIYVIQSIEEKVLADPELMEKLKRKVREDWPEKAEEIIRDFSKITLFRKGADYADMQSYLLSVFYCLETSRKFHPSARVFWDKGNIAIRPNGILSFNGLLFNLSNREIAELEANGKKPTEEMLKEIASIEQFFFRHWDYYSELVIPPEEVYIRHAQSISPNEVLDPVTLNEVKKGRAGCDFSYKLDYRGLAPASERNYCIGFDNTDAHLSKNISNFAVVGDGAAFPVGFARLAEFNASAAFNVGKEIIQKIV